MASIPGAVTNLKPKDQSELKALVRETDCLLEHKSSTRRGWCGRVRIQIYEYNLGAMVSGDVIFFFVLAQHIRFACEVYARSQLWTNILMNFNVLNDFHLHRLRMRQ